MLSSKSNAKVSVLVPDISSNVLWAATAIAKALQGRYEVQVVGPDMGSGALPMYERQFEYTRVPAPWIYRFPNFFFDALRIADAVTGDVIIAVKAYLDTVPLAVWRKWRSGKRVMVYLDEWDAASYYQLKVQERCLRWLRHFHHPLDDVYFPLAERFIRSADRVVCSSQFLQHEFGGRIIPLGVDTDEYRPASPAAGAVLKASLGVKDSKVIVFGGVVRPHKGLESILEALTLLNDPRIRLLVVGPETEHLKRLKQSGRFAAWFQCIGAQPKDKMPAYLDIADLIVIPQSDSLLARSQVPCKVFEAMAMAKPIIATQVSDLPEILAECGWIVPPDDSRALAEGIKHVVENPAEAAARGKSAREKCMKLYSRKQTELLWGEAVAEVLGG